MYNRTLPFSLSGTRGTILLIDLCVILSRAASLILDILLPSFDNSTSSICARPSKRASRNAVKIFSENGSLEKNTGGGGRKGGITFV